MIPFQLTDCNQRKILTADVCQILKDLCSLAPIGIQINHRLVWRGTFEYIYSFLLYRKEFILPPPHHWRMLRKLRGSESPAPVPSYLYSPLVPPYFCAYIVFEISTKVNFCFINFDASSLPAFSPNHVKDRQRGKDWPPSFWASSTASRYTLLTQEEIFRLAVSLVMLRRCSWMIRL